MARKKRPTIRGEDPAYRSDFSARNFQKLPTVEPDSAANDLDVPTEEPTAAAAPPRVASAENSPTKAAFGKPDPASASMAVPKPEATPAAPAPEPAAKPAKPVRAAKARSKIRQAPPRARRSGKGRGVAEAAPKREVAIVASAKAEQHEKLLKLEDKGIAAKDALTLAGRRAIERFEPEAKYVEKLDVDRMPMRQGYRSTKRIDAALIDALRDENDPLRIRSDAAMVIGQFEPLFWECIDEVIKELNRRF